MGIGVATRLATVATPSVHVEMATELLARAGGSFDRVVIAAEPLFLKELAETALRRQGPGFADRVAACFVGGEWVAESWRRYVSELFGFGDGDDDRLGLMVSMGAAEVGLHVLHETPELRQRAAGARLARHPRGPLRPRPGLLPHAAHVGPEPLLHRARGATRTAAGAWW